MPLYTRTGDKGETSLFGGKRVLKSDDRVETYGTIDELNSVLGVVLAQLVSRHSEEKKILEKIQKDLFVIGAYLANPLAEPLTQLEQRVTEFEKIIDQQTERIPLLRNFILPGGGKAGATLHYARTVCRRAERKLVALMQKEDLDTTLLKYLNRLSDLLYSTARFINHKEKKKETIWTNIG
jgi:cob(I)alamin adenosyltransferase